MPKDSPDSMLEVAIDAKRTRKEQLDEAAAATDEGVKKKAAAKAIGKPAPEPTASAGADPVRKPDEPYKEYIARVAASRAARGVEP